MSDSCNCNISTFITSDFKGVNLDDLEGEIGVFQTVYRQGNQTLVIEDIELVATSDSTSRDLKLISDMVRGELTGKFKTEDIYQSLDHLFYLSFPALFDQEVLPSTGDVIFEYAFEIENTDSATKMFLPNFQLIEPFFISGNLNSRDSIFTSQAMGDQFRYGNANFQNFRINNNSRRGIIQTNITTDRILIGDSLEILNYDFNTKGVKNLIQFETSFDNQDSAKNFGNLDGMLFINNSKKFDFSFMNSDISIDGLHWRLSARNSIKIDSTSIDINNFELFNDSQKVIVEGKITEDPKDKVLAFVDNIRIETLDKFYHGTGLSLSGIANGNAVISNPYHGLELSADLSFKQLVINKDSLDYGNINAGWKTAQKAISLNGNIGNQFTFGGNYFPVRQGDNLDVTLSMEEFGLKKV